MQSMKKFALRRLPKPSRWVYTEAKADQAATSNGLQAFALGLNKRLTDVDAGRSVNLVFSPLSVYAALSLVATGARDCTLDELLGVLGAPSRDFLTGHVRALSEHALADRSQTGGPRVNFACGVWHDKTMPLRPAYRDAAAESFKAVARAVNFRQKAEEACGQINAWVSKSTNGLIPSILSPGALSHRTDLVLANAIYFKGKWEKTFNKEHTKDGKFHRLDGTAVDAPFMRGVGKHSIACHDGFKVLQMRYEQGRTLPAQPTAPAPIYSMCVFLPNARDGLWRLTDKITCNPDFLRKHMSRRDVLVGDFRLPKFMFGFDIMNMTDVLREMGVKEALELGKADLSDMAEDDGSGRRLALQQVIHKAVIEVNEEGTKAAAVTLCAGLKTSCRNAAPPPPRVNFVADHPFAFFVIEEVSGAILFAGHVLDPTIK